MPWPVHPTGFFGARGDNDTYRIERSLRFNSADTTYLTRTFGTPTNQNVWTLSVWLKRSAFSGSGIFGASSSGVTNYEAIYFDSSSNLLAETYINLPPIQARNQKTNALFRDPSAWYHFVVVKNGSWASSYPYTIYVNGVSQSVTTFDLNTSFVNRINSSGVTHQIGADGLTSNLFNGYMTELYFIDGQALTPSSFGETDAITGRWKARAYSGTYGTNGFYLKFADNSGTTDTTLGKDSSPNGNNWTPNNFSVTAGAGNDSLVDSPTNYGTDTGVGGEVRGNYATLNPLDKDSGLTLSNGNLDLVGANAGGASTFGITSGKWYWEVTITDPYTSAGLSYWGVFGVSSGRSNSYISGLTSYPVGAGVYANNTTADAGTYSNGSRVTTQTTWANNDVIGFAFDAGAMTLDVYRNNSKIGTTLTVPSGAIYPSFFHNGVSGDTGSSTINFGQRPFAYAAPTGFKALCTTNLPTPTIQKPSKYMDVVTYTGNGSTQTISGLGFSPDFVWIKARSSAFHHGLFDTVRGATKALYSSLTNAEATEADSLTAFNSDGFSLGADTAGFVNRNSVTHVAWAWDAGETSSTNTAGSITSTVRVNAQAGVSIVSYTGTGANTTVGHGLGSAPKFIFGRRRNSPGSWQVFHLSIPNMKDGYITLNATTGYTSLNTIWNATNPTSTVFSLGTDADLNQNGTNMIAYLFAEVEGFSKFGSYTGNGSSDGPFVFTGMRPRWVMIKRTDSAGSWYIIDTARGTTNVVNPYLLANASNTEASDLSWDILSNGFKLRSSYVEINNSSATYVYAAFAESPFKYARAR